MTIEDLDFGRGHGRNFDHLTMVFLKFWPWLWSKFFDHMTKTPGRRSNGQKIMVALPPPQISLNVSAENFGDLGNFKATNLPLIK